MTQDLADSFRNGNYIDDLLALNFPLPTCALLCGRAFRLRLIRQHDLHHPMQGFDPEYRDGAGYDDNDFLMRLDRAGAGFVMRDDLVVDHPRDGCKARYSPEMYARNRGLFLRKWGDD